MGKRRWTDDQLIDAVANSYSIAQVLNKLGLLPAGGNYELIKRYIRVLELDNSHFTGKGWSLGKKCEPNNEISLEEVLSSGRLTNSNRLRKRLIKLEIKKEECENCGITEWMGESPPLELDHIDGNKENNLLDNLRILCANCHAKTSTYRGKNKKHMVP